MYLFTSRSCICLDLKFIYIWSGKLQRKFMESCGMVLILTMTTVVVLIVRLSKLMISWQDNGVIYTSSFLGVPKIG